MYLNSFWHGIQNYVYTAGGTIAVMITLFIFLGKKWVDNLASRSLAKQKNELMAQLGETNNGA